MSASENPVNEVINFFIDGQPVQAKPGWTILETARHYRIHIPTLCYHPAVKPWGSCRLCVVETRYGKRERVIPWYGGWTATAGYLMPWGKRLTKPLLDRIGRHHKRQYLQHRAQGRSHAGHTPTRQL